VKGREVVLTSRVRAPKIQKNELIAFLLDLMGRLNLQGSVHVLVCGKRRMANLNREFRGISGPTDVLSFPDGTPGEDGVIHIGDIAVAARVVEENARRLGHGFEEEMKRMLLHGLLHLLGYDHEADNGRMRRKELKLAREWGLPT
jgi:probable rRNA maturation factor